MNKTMKTTRGCYWEQRTVDSNTSINEMKIAMDFWLSWPKVSRWIEYGKSSLQQLINESYFPMKLIEIGTIPEVMGNGEPKMVSVIE